ncbi:MAG TPA: energy-coupling factor transporter transmembrane protein EcfT [Candidatus Bathyarchaeota archaeon]|nr:energy-coupling factor transporter transmembrane protein EcfT [Candidatus Bathyarchaeota archaeon]
MSSLLESLAFQKRDSVLHRLDPRVKLAYAILMIAIAAVFCVDPTTLRWEWRYSLPYIVLFACQVPLAVLGKVGRLWLRTLKASLPLALLIVGTNLLVVWMYGQLDVYQLERVVGMGFFFLALVASFSIFTLTTSPDDLSLALEQMGVPFWFCFIFRAALRFTPLMAREARITIDAQRARGLELDKGGPIARARRYVPILVPLIVNAVKRAWDMAEAMESRAWGATGKRTSLYVLRLSGWDYLALCIMLFALIMAIYVRMFFQVPYLLPYILPLLEGLL